MSSDRPMKRSLLLLILLCFLSLLFGAANLTGRHVAAVSSNIVISEFRTRGPNGAGDEFIELFNLSSAPVSIGGWQIKASNGAGAITVRAVINGGVVLGPRCRYLLTDSNPTGGPYSGAIPGDQTYGVSIADDGGIALTAPDGTIIDQVGMSPGSAFGEGNRLAQLTTSTNRSYERIPGPGGIPQDTDNNTGDFRLISPSSPQNSASACDAITMPSPTDPSGVGKATPDLLDAGGETLLTVAVTPGSNPTSTGLTVSGNLAPIGESTSQIFFDNGTNGDIVAGDGIFSFSASIGLAISPGAKVLTILIADLQLRTGPVSIALNIRASEASPCGVERWAVKTGMDPDSAFVNLAVINATTIKQMTQWARPATIPESSRVVPQEETIYTVSGRLTEYKSEDDSDYHLVIRDNEGRSFIAEIPCTCCIGAQSPFLEKIELVRRQFDSKFSITGDFQTSNVPVIVSGVAFFDFIHGQRGVAPNGIELHPVLGIEFDVDSAAPVILGVSAAGKKLFVTGLNFADGAKVFFGPNKQKTRNDEESPETSLICKKAARDITSGDTVLLQVRNPDGALSNSFSFKRP